MLKLVQVQDSAAVFEKSLVLSWRAQCGNLKAAEGRATVR